MDNRAGAGGIRGWWADRPIRVKLGVLVTVLVTSSIGCAVVGAVGLGTLNDYGHANYRGQLRLHEVGVAQQQVALVRADLRDHLLTRDPVALERFATAIRADDAKLVESLATYERLGTDATAARDLADFREDYAAYTRIRDERILTASAAGRKDEAYQVLVNDAVADYKQAVVHLTALATHQVASGAATAATSEDKYQLALWLLVGDLLVGLSIGVGLALLTTRSIVRPVLAVAGRLDAMAAGDLTGRVADGRRDEIGRMAASATRAAIQMSETIEHVADGAAALAVAAARLESVSGEVAIGAADTADHADAVASTASQISANVRTVADGAGQLNSSIRDIVVSATDAAQVGEEAVATAGQTSVKVGRLGEASAEVTRVVELISAIAAQTGLLALNASIEAVRAGAYGRGFAVVANEVKALAQQTAAASEDVTRRILAMQEETGVTAGAIDAIVSIIERLEETQVSIAGAVDQQSRTTMEIAASVGQAASGASDIAATIAGVATAARVTTAAVTDVRQSAGELAALSERLRDQVSRFTIKV